MAVVSDKVNVRVVDVREFPNLAVKYNVGSVSEVVINEEVRFTGVHPENIFLGYVIAGSKTHLAFYT
ncbi:MAG: thioredoxin family protein [Candidatus Odinarchaeia archaeon]